MPILLHMTAYFILFAGKSQQIEQTDPTTTS